MDRLVGTWKALKLYNLAREAQRNECARVTERKEGRTRQHVVDPQHEDARFGCNELAREEM